MLTGAAYEGRLRDQGPGFPISSLAAVWMVGQQWIGRTGEGRFQGAGAVIHLSTGCQNQGEMWADGETAGLERRTGRDQQRWQGLQGINGIHKFTRRGTQVEEQGMKETELGTAQRAEECKHSGTGKKGEKKNKKGTDKIQSQREAEQLSGSGVCQIPPTDEMPEVTLDLATKSHSEQ